MSVVLRWAVCGVESESLVRGKRWSGLDEQGVTQDDHSPPDVLLSLYSIDESNEENILSPVLTVFFLSWPTQVRKTTKSTLDLLFQHRFLIKHLLHTRQHITWENKQYSHPYILSVQLLFIKGLSSDVGQGYTKQNMKIQPLLIRSLDEAVGHYREGLPVQKQRAGAPEGTSVSVHCLWGIPWCSAVNNPPTMQEMKVRSLGQEDPLEEGMATHSSILARRIQWTEEPGGLPSVGSQRVRYNRSDWAPAPVVSMAGVSGEKVLSRDFSSDGQENERSCIRTKRKKKHLGVFRNCHKRRQLYNQL